MLFLGVKKIGDIFRRTHPIEKKFLSSLSQRSLTLSLTKDHGVRIMALQACRNFYKFVNCSLKLNLDSTSKCDFGQFVEVTENA